MKKTTIIGVASFLLWSSLFWTQVLTAQPVEFYPDGFPQFGTDTWFDGNLLIVDRAGNGKHRTCERAVFEVVDNGKRLRQLFHLPLKNPYMPLESFYTNEGRFMVTVGEFEGTQTAQCLVVYDMLHRTSKAFKLEDFLDKNTIANLKQHAFLNGKNWYGLGEIDQLNLRFYPSAPNECRDRNYPYVVLDLRSFSITNPPVPVDDREAQTELGAYQDRSMIDFDWSMGETDEPKWDVAMKLPKFVKLKRSDRNGVEITNAVFELDANARDYLATSSEKWRSRKTSKQEGKKEDNEAALDGRHPRIRKRD